MTARYTQLRVDDASSARNARSAAANQQAARIQGVRILVMEPDFLKGFDEADRGKDVQIKVSDQESNAPPVYHGQCDVQLIF